MAALDLSPGVLDISGVRAGDRNAIRMTLTQDGAPLSLVGAEIAAQARPNPSAPGALDAVIEQRVDAAGQFVLRWPGEEVRLLLGGEESWVGVWDLQIIRPPDTEPDTVVAGKFSAMLDVTRPGEAFSGGVSVAQPAARPSVPVVQGRTRRQP